MAGGPSKSKSGTIPATKGARLATPIEGAKAAAARVELRGDHGADDGLNAARAKLDAMTGGGKGRAAEHRRIREAIAEYRDAQDMARAGTSKAFLSALGDKTRPALTEPLAKRREMGRKAMAEAGGKIKAALEARRDAQALRRPVAAEQGDLFAGLGGAKVRAVTPEMAAQSKATWERARAKREKLDALREQRDDRRLTRAERRLYASQQRAAKAAEANVATPPATPAPKAAPKPMRDVVAEQRAEDANSLRQMLQGEAAKSRARVESTRRAHDEQMSSQRGQPLVTSTKPSKIMVVRTNSDGHTRREEADSLRAVRGIHLTKLSGGGYTITDQTTGSMLVGADSKAHGERLLKAMTKGRTVDRALAPIREGRPPTPAETRAGKAIARLRRLDIHRSVARSSAAAAKAVATKRANEAAAGPPIAGAKAPTPPARTRRTNAQRTLGRLPSYGQKLKAADTAAEEAAKQVRSARSKTKLAEAKSRETQLRGRAARLRRIVEAAGQKYNMTPEGAPHKKLFGAGSAAPADTSPGARRARAVAEVNAEERRYFGRAS